MVEAEKSFVHRQHIFKFLIFTENLQNKQLVTVITRDEMQPMQQGSNSSTGLHFFPFVPCDPNNCSITDNTLRQQHF